MAGPEDDTDKSHEPTQHKLDEARKKGDVARSADLNTAATYAGFLLLSLAIGPSTAEQMGNAMTGLIDRSGRLSRMLFDGAPSAALASVMASMSLALGVWFVVPGLCAILSVIAQRGFVVAPSKLKPKLSRINPVQNAKNKYGSSGLFEFAKSFVKLLLYSVVLGLFLSYRLTDMSGALHADPRIIGGLMGRMVIEFMGIVLIIALLIGVVDFLWQYHDHRRKLRMSHKEVRDEHKQHEGDPHLKQERRQRGQKIAMEQMMADVPAADVIVVNPTHFAVALKWSRTPGSAPVCVAKGQDHVALAIRECGRGAGVPIHSDPPTARSLFVTTRIGEEISPDHYRPVAAAIRFAETMRCKARYL